MRLIDADKLHPDRMTNKGTVAISQSQIANAKTVEAVPLSVIEDIKAEIERESDYKPYEMYDMKWAFNKALSIIDNAVSEVTHDGK